MDKSQILRVFFDITDADGLAATGSGSVTKQYNSGGYAPFNGQLKNYMTPNTVTSSTTNGATLREVYGLWIIPPINSNGQYEDLREVQLQLDGHQTGHYLTLPGRGDILMTPFWEQVRGGKRFFVPFGTPLWKLPQDKGPNKPLRYTCPKYSNKLELSVSSIYGVTGAGSGGFRIIMVGYEYDADTLAFLNRFWSNTVNLQTVRRDIEGRPPLQFTYAPIGPLSLDNGTGYPGGTAQRGIKVWPYWHFAYNAAATSGTNNYVLSNRPSVGGTSNNVEDDFQDLGFEFAQNHDAAIIQGWGVRGVDLPPGQTGAPGPTGQNLARAGWNLNGTYIPEETGNQNGIYITPSVNPLTFGAVPGVANIFDPVPRVPGEPLLIYRDNAAPFVAGIGSGIPQDNVVVAINGVLVEQG